MEKEEKETYDVWPPICWQWAWSQMQPMVIGRTYTSNDVIKYHQKYYLKCPYRTKILGHQNQPMTLNRLVDKSPIDESYQDDIEWD